MGRILRPDVCDMSTEKWLEWVKKFNICITDSFEDDNPAKPLYTRCISCGASKLVNTKCEYCGQ